MPGILQINGESLQINGQDLQINGSSDVFIVASLHSDAETFRTHVIGNNITGWFIKISILLTLII